MYYLNQQFGPKVYHEEPEMKEFKSWTLTVFYNNSCKQPP